MDLLQGVIRNYDWGDRRAIAELLGHRPTGKPEAEYWLGAHPSAPSRLLLPGPRSEAGPTLDPDHAALGPDVAARFDGLPFLLKILAADQPLSIQAHPSRDQAVAGFAREEAAGIDIAAPDRNYRDENHKPELICAITPFEAKCGFRPLADSRRLIDGLAGGPPPAAAGPLSDIGSCLATAGSEAEVLAAAVAWLLGLPARDRAAMTEAAVAAAAAAPASLRDEFGPELEWTGRIAAFHPGDIGVVVALLLNHVTLAPGQAMFLRAGNLHSYLQGVGIELMANSDNVLRGGLTSKHVDIAELLDIVDHRPELAPIQAPRGPVHRFDSPVPEFSLVRLDSSLGPLAGADGLPIVPVGPEILLVTSGRIEVVREADRRSLPLPGGTACFVGHDDGPYRIIDLHPGHTVAWRATSGSDLSSQ